MTNTRARQIFDSQDAIDLVHVIYPEDVFVTDDVIIGWAHDSMVNRAVDEHVKAHGLIADDETHERIVAGVEQPDLEAAMDFLSDIGSHTFERFDQRCGMMSINRMSDALRPVGRRCFPKEQHDTRGAAEAQLRSITKRGLEKTPHIHVYECPHCTNPETGKPYWHVGTSLPR